MSDLDLFDRAVRAIKAWRRLAPEKKFFGMLVDEFEKLAAPSGATRAKLRSLDKQTQNVMAERDEADKVTRRGLLRLGNAVKGDPEFGEDCQLLSDMGYVPHTARNSIAAAGRRNASKAALAAAGDADDEALDAEESE